MKKSIVVEIISALFILLFMYAATSKLMDVQKFTIQLGQSPLLSSFSGVVAVLVPSVEIIIAILLCFKQSRLAGLYASFSLMVMFTAYIIAITRFSQFIPCSCGGILQKMSWNQHLLFNIFFVGLGTAAIFLHNATKAEPTSSHSYQPT